MNRGGRQAPGAGSGQRAPQGGNAGYTQNAPAQDLTQGLGDQYGAGNDGQQPPEDLHDQQGYGQANGDMSGNQEGAAGVNGMYNQQQEDEDQENDAQNGGDHMAMKKKNAAPVMMAPGKMGEKKPFTTKPQHAHSRFAQDPHHHNMMSSFHKIASEGLSPAHIESFVHIGTYALAHLAKQSGMTAGHAPDEAQDGQGQVQ